MTVLSSYSILLGGISTSSTYSILGHSREISCFSSTAHTDFLIVPLLKTQHNTIKYMCCSYTEYSYRSLGNTVESWPCLYINSCVLLCFYSGVLLILHPPALIFIHFQGEKEDISLLWPIRFLYLLDLLVCIVASFPGTLQVGLDVYSFHFCIHVYYLFILCLFISGYNIYLYCVCIFQYSIRPCLLEHY